MLHGTGVVALFFHNDSQQIVGLRRIGKFPHGLANHGHAFLKIPGFGIFPHPIAKGLQLHGAAGQFLCHHPKILLLPSDLSYGVILARKP